MPDRNCVWSHYVLMQYEKHKYSGRIQDTIQPGSTLNAAVHHCVTHHARDAVAMAAEDAHLFTRLDVNDV